MNLPSSFENRSDPDGLQEIRSWASRSPDAVRPVFRARHRLSRPRPSSRHAGSVVLALLLLFVAYSGHRFLQTGQGTAEIAAVPEQVEPQAPAPAPPPISDPNRAADEAPAVAEVLPDGPRVRREPLEAQASPQARKPGKSAQTRVVVNRDAFESEPAVLLSTPAAHYPDAARGTGTRAEVIVGFTIDETGAVRDPRIESAKVEGDASESVFAEAALAAARRARFEPARERGVPASSWSTLTFTFEAGPRG